MTEERQKTARLLSRVLLAWSWLVLALVVGGALYTRASFGSWPRVYRDDPADPIVDFVSYFSLLGMFSMALVPVLAAAVLAARGAYGLRPVWDKSVVSALLVSAVLYVIVRADPHGYVTWLFD